jgi:two-component system, NarL family, sensor histidine kinase DesK
VVSVSEVLNQPPLGQRRYGAAFASIWLLFLIPVVQAAWSLRDSGRGWLGLASVLAFSTIYVTAFALRRQRDPGSFGRDAPGPAGIAVLAALMILEVTALLSVGYHALAMTVFIGVACMINLPLPIGVAAVIVLAAASETAARLVPGWTHADGIALSVCLAGAAMFGVIQLVRRNFDLLLARAENARLEVQEERNRLARDLHDILGHSLTVITVKAELAGRLVDVDAKRAKSELGDLERLARDALADVRRTVEGYHEITLPGELARARMALEAAGITPELPRTTEAVPSDLRELFAWSVREGVTNVVRHSGASRCTVTIEPTAVTVNDDGRGPASGHPNGGHGLRGLRERAAAMGASVATGPLEPHGFCLSVQVSPSEAQS